MEAALAEKDEEFLGIYNGSRLGIGGGEFLAEWAERYEDALRRRRKVEDVALRRVGRRLEVDRIVEVSCRHLGVEAGVERCRRRESWVRPVVARMLSRYGGLTQRAIAERLGVGTGKSVLHVPRERRGLDHFTDDAERPMRMGVGMGMAGDRRDGVRIGRIRVFVVVRMRRRVTMAGRRGLRRLVTHEDPQPDALYPAVGGHLGLDAERTEFERTQGLLDFARLDTELRQRRENHVAGSAAESLDPQRARHDAGSPTRLMNAAATPAPKPLSILTTVMPGTHELSIASRAANPWKLAP